MTIDTLRAAALARINGVALHTMDDKLSPDELRQRACTELLRQTAQARRGAAFRVGAWRGGHVAASADLRDGTASIPAPAGRQVPLCCGNPPPHNGSDR
jgi:hypothetical protein